MGRFGQFAVIEKVQRLGGGGVAGLADAAGRRGGGRRRGRSGRREMIQAGGANGETEEDFTGIDP